MNVSLVASYDVRPGTGEGLLWFWRFINLSLTLLTYSSQTHVRPTVPDHPQYNITQNHNLLKWENAVYELEQQGYHTSSKNCRTQWARRMFADSCCRAATQTQSTYFTSDHIVSAAEKGSSPESRPNTNELQNATNTSTSDGYRDFLFLTSPQPHLVKMGPSK